MDNTTEIRTRRKIPENERIAIFEVWGNKCVYCHEPTPAVHIDHIYPFAKGGTCELENLVPSCEMHNLLKSDSILTEAGMELLLTKAKEKAPRIRQRIETHHLSITPTVSTPTLMDKNLIYNKSEFPVYFNTNISLRGIRVFITLLQHNTDDILFSEINRNIHLSMDDMTNVIIELSNFSPSWAKMENVFDDIRILNDSQWMIEYKLNRRFIDHFNALYNFDFNNKILNEFRSKYSLLLYMYFMNYRCNKGSVILSVSDLRDLLLIDKELYDRWGNIRQRVIYPAFEELKSYGIHCSIAATTRRGKKTSKIKINFDQTAARQLPYRQNNNFK